MPRKSFLALAAPKRQEIMDICKEESARKPIDILEVGMITKHEKEFPIFMVVLNNKAGIKKTICFSMGIHGDEIAGPASVIKFVKEYDAKCFADLRIIIFPFANPFGYSKKRRNGSKNTDLNTSFRYARLRGENRILYNAVKDQKLFFFHALHEYLIEDRFFLYAYTNKKTKFFRRIITEADNFFPILQRSDFPFRSKVRIYNGVIYNYEDLSFEYRLFKEGAKYCLCTETPGTFPLQKRVEANVKIMNMVANFSKRAKS